MKRVIVVAVSAAVLTACGASERAAQNETAQPSLKSSLSAQRECEKRNTPSLTSHGTLRLSFVRGVSSCMAQRGFKHVDVKYYPGPPPKVTTVVKEVVTP